jgi:DNA primase
VNSTSTTNAETGRSSPSIEDDARHYGFRRSIRIVKEAVALENYAGELTSLRREGQHLVGLCPVHQEKTPSFKINDGRWHCFGACNKGGDVLDLFMKVERYGAGEKMEAMIALAMRYSVELGPPETWAPKQVRQQPVRDAMEELKIRRLQRFLYKTAAPFITDLNDAERTWRECAPLARMWFARMQEEKE